MDRLLLINSLGPMGSSLLAGLVEKIGYTNIPLRKIGLHNYLTDPNLLNSGLMQSRLEQSILEHSKPGLYGGVSIIDRNSEIARPLTDFNIVKQDLECFKTQKFENVSEIYFRATEIYCKSVVYKKITTSPRWRIELTTDIHKYKPGLILEAYRAHFPTVHMIHISRPYIGWINSLASQAFTHPSFQNRVKFFPHLKAADLDLYNERISMLPGLSIDFEEIFEIPVEVLASKVSSYVDLPPPAINLRHETYDLYGKPRPYEIAFKKFDDKIQFLSPSTKSFLQKKYELGLLRNRSSAFIAWILYMVDLVRWGFKS